MSRTRIAWQIALWAAIAFATTMALLPHPPHLPIDDWGDKAEHMLAFGTIAVLSAGAYPRFPLPRIAERLSFMGALIEVLQSIPALGRDCDIMDWVADTAMIVVVVTVIGVVRGRAGAAERR